MSRSAPVIWLEGLPGSGKTTLARLLQEHFEGQGRLAEVLDGDEVRKGLSPELGFSREDRERHADRVCYVADLLSRNGVLVVVALITPYESSRLRLRQKLGHRLLEVWLDCPLEVCTARDPKGLYRKAKEGTVRNMTGMGDPFEPPLDASLVLDTAQLGPQDCLHRLLARVPHTEAR